MQIVLYEFLTGGGWTNVFPQMEMPTTLLGEGRAMIQSLAHDFAQLPDVQTVVLRDSTMPQLDFPGCHIIPVSADKERSILEQVSQTVDGVILIAPEFFNLLIQRVQWVTDAGGKLLSPDAAFVQLTADKYHTSQLLSASGVPVPSGILLPDDTPWPDWLTYPVVLKPRFGAGSQDTFLLHEPPPPELRLSLAGDFLVETFQPGLAASVSFLCGPAGNLALVPNQQRLTEDGRFIYLGGILPLPPSLSQRAVQLASQALHALPAAMGYVGIDLVLGEAASQDVVMEINPRLTTSYIGLRAAYSQNLANAWLQVASGFIPPLNPEPVTIQYDADGNLSKTT